MDEDKNQKMKEEEDKDSLETEETDPEEEKEEQPKEDIRKIGADTNDSIAFYPPPAKKKSKKTLYLVIILVLILVFIGFIFKHQIKNLVTGGAKPTPTPTATLTPAPTPNPLNRSDWSLEVLNGTTTSGLAKKLADKLTILGYPVIKTGNADKQNYETTQILVKKELLDKIDLVAADLKDTVKIASVAGELKEGTASARIIIGKDLSL